VFWIAAGFLPMLEGGSVRFQERDHTADQETIALGFEAAAISVTGWWAITIMYPGDAWSFHGVILGTFAPKTSRDGRSMGGRLFQRVRTSLPVDGFFCATTASHRFGHLWPRRIKLVALPDFHRCADRLYLSDRRQAGSAARAGCLTRAFSGLCGLQLCARSWRLCRRWQGFAWFLPSYRQVQRWPCGSDCRVRTCHSPTLGTFILWGWVVRL